MKKEKESNVDEEFDLFLQKFIDDALDDETYVDEDYDDDDDEAAEPDTSDDHEEPNSSCLPFPP